MTETTDTQIVLGSLATTGPKQLISTATEIAGNLAKIIADRGLAVEIRGRQYVKCEGWTTCAAMLGVTAREVSVEEDAEGNFVAVVDETASC